MRRCIVWLFAIILFSSVGCDCGDITQGCKEDSDCTGRACKVEKCWCKEGVCTDFGGPCANDADCHETEQCKNGTCVSKRCGSDTDCPDGEKCNTLLGTCYKDTSGCTDDTSCTNGKVCCDLGDGQGTRCNFPKCLVHEDCQTGSKNTCVKPITCEGSATAACIGGVCKCEEPCGGADCGSGKCCQASSNQCIDNPQPCADLQCPPGTDPPPADQFTTDPKSCQQTGPKCECIKRKPLPVGEAGLDSEIALLSGKAVVSAYNKTYGDLVVGFEQADGTVKWEFVDGIPAGGKVVGAADGPRGGIEDGGDDVGLHTSIAVANTNVYVSYHDKTNGTLKFALRKGDAWTTHVVDKTGKGVGRYTSLTMANGNPAIAYFVVDDGSGNTALRVAVAKSAEPGAETDWTITTVTSAALPACKGACDAAKKEVCVQEGTAFSCKVPTAKEADCKPTACKESEEACVSGKCLKIVADVANPPLPKGVGLFPSVASNAAGALYITFYDNNKGDLKLARQPAAGGKFTVSTLDSTGDVGQFTSLALDAQERGHVAYVDIDNGDIKYVLFDKTGKVSATEVVDDGFTNSATGGEEHLLADCSIAVDSTGKPRIVYQDATVQSIKMAIQTNPKQWTKKKLAGAGGSEAGAFGFFADQVLNNNTSHISNYRYDLKNDNSGLNLRTWQP